MGATGTKSFALVYNIKDPKDLHRRFFGVDGSLIALGGVAFNYLQRGGYHNCPYTGRGRLSGRRQSRLFEIFSQNRLDAVLINRFEKAVELGGQFIRAAG